jgi:peptidoglycan/LPS O-acetylase OafA/YrhL
MDQVTRAEYGRLMDELRAGMAPPEPPPGQQLVPPATRGWLAGVLALAAFAAVLAAILAPGEHATYWQSLGHCGEFIAGMGICAMLGGLGKARRNAAAKQRARRR